MVELEIGDVGFCGGRKTGEPEENPSERGARTQPTDCTRPESNPDNIGGRRALWSLGNPCCANRF